MFSELQSVFLVLKVSLCTYMHPYTRTHIYMCVDVCTCLKMGWGVVEVVERSRKGARDRKNKAKLDGIIKMLGLYFSSICTQLHPL